MVIFFYLYQYVKLFIINCFLENSKGETVTDINSNEDETNRTIHCSSKSRDSSNSRVSIKRERELDCNVDDDREDADLDEDIEEEGSEKDHDIKIRKEELDAAIFDAIEHEEENEEKEQPDDKNGIIRDKNRRRSSSDPVNLSLGSRGEDSEDAHIDVESVGSAPSKVIKII